MSRIGFAHGVYAVKPTKFCTNDEALLDNKFMHQDHDQDCQAFSEQIQNQHRQFVKNMQDADIDVTVLLQQSDDAPDAIFPDWFTCYKGESVPDGVLIIHPMFYRSRRNERSPVLLEKLKESYKHVIDLTHFEEQGKALEGKGAIVFDHRNRRFFCALSNRSHIEVINELVEKFNEISVDGQTNPYEAITFQAKDRRGDVIYHTDCLMSLHGYHAFICLDAIRDEEEKARVLRALTNGPLYPFEILELSLSQIEHMSANAQSVTNNKGESCIVQSLQGFTAMTPEQKEILNSRYKMVISDVGLVESVGGGSCRCMLVENWSTVDSSLLVPNSDLIEAKNTQNLMKRIDFFKSKIEESDSDTLSSCDESDECSEINSLTFKITRLCTVEDNFFELEEENFDSRLLIDNYWDKHFNNPIDDLQSLQVLDQLTHLKVGQSLSKMKLAKKFPKHATTQAPQLFKQQRSQEIQKSDFFSSNEEIGDDFFTELTPEKKNTFEKPVHEPKMQSDESFLSRKAPTMEKLIEQAALTTKFFQPRYYLIGNAQTEKKLIWWPKCFTSSSLTEY